MERWEKVNTVQKMQDYIRDHINQRINMEKGDFINEGTY